MENVLWRAMNLLILQSLKYVVLCGTNNLFTDSTMDIADCIVNIGSCLHEKSSNIKISICGIVSLGISSPIENSPPHVPFPPTFSSHKVFHHKILEGGRSYTKIPLSKGEENMWIHMWL